MSKLKSYDAIVKISAEWYGTVEARSHADAKRLAEAAFNDGDLRQIGEEVEAVIAFRPRSRTGSWSTFERRFRPINSSDDTVWWSQEQLPDNVDPHRVWTILDEDGRLYVMPGYRFVNRLDYVLCELPWTDVDLHQPGYRYD